jgi:hypothetical protein
MIFRHFLARLADVSNDRSLPPLSDQSSASPFETERIQISTDPTEYLNNNNQSFEVVLDRGTRYMVVDCGRGTVDIAVYELDYQMRTLK